jgi:hypothetical protein
MMLQTIHFNMIAVFIVCMLLSFASGSGQQSDTTDLTTEMTSNSTEFNTTNSSTNTSPAPSSNISTKQQSIIMPISIIGSLFILFFIRYTE